jgi:hypothetical protein
MPITPDQIKQAIEEGIINAFKDPAIHCRYAISPEEHINQHAAIARFMVFTEKIENIKWKALQTLVIAIIMGLFGLVVFGAAVKIKLFTFLGIIR